MAIDPIPAEMQACKNCRFLRRIGAHLECRRCSPKIFLTDEGDQPGFWPDVCETDWCGEWQERV